MSEYDFLKDEDNIKLVGKISNLIDTQLPDFVKEEGPIFSEFLKLYYRWMESHELTISMVIQDEYHFNLESEQGSFILETSDDLLLEGNRNSSSAYDLNETITGLSSGATGRVDRNTNTASSKIYVTNVTKLDFEVGEIIKGSKNRTIGTVISFEKNPLFASRTLLKSRDIDSVTSSMLDNFTKEFLVNFPMKLRADKSRLIKHISNVYRSKGTSASYDFLFKSLYDTQALTFYTPKIDILKPSSGNWQQDQSIRIITSDPVSSFESHSITGSRSGAFGIVNRVLKFAAGVFDVMELFLTDQSGTFIVGEEIISNDVDGVYGTGVSQGLITEIIISSAGSNYKIGQKLTITGGGGVEAKAKISTIGAGSLTHFTVFDGGDGYVENKTLTVNNFATLGSGFDGKVKDIIDTFTFSKNEDIIGNFSSVFLNDPEYELSGNTGSNISDKLIDALGFSKLDAGHISSIQTTGSGTGYEAIPAISIVEPTTEEFTEAAVQILNLNADPDDHSLTTAITDFFVPGEKITSNSGNKIGTFFGEVTSQSSIADPSRMRVKTIKFLDELVTRKIPADQRNDILVNNSSYLTSSQPSVYHLRFVSGGSSLINTIKYRRGIDSRELFNSANNNLTCDWYPSSGGIEITGGYQTLNFGITSITRSSTTATVITYGKHGLVDGQIVAIKGADQLEYNKNATIALANTTVFTYTVNGSPVTPATGTITYDENISVKFTLPFGHSVDDEYAFSSVDFASNDIITGSKSGAVATVNTGVAFSSGGDLGNNAIIGVSAADVGSGSIKSIIIQDPGIGFTSSPQVSLPGLGEENAVLTARIGAQRKEEGIYLDENGQLSSNKKLIDSDFYQDYSYSLIVNKQLNDYQEIIFKLLHPTGTKLFGEFTPELVELNVGFDNKLKYEGGDFAIKEDDDDILLEESSDPKHEIIFNNNQNLSLGLISLTGGSNILQGTVNAYMTLDSGGILILEDSVKLAFNNPIATDFGLTYAEGDQVIIDNEQSFEISYGELRLENYLAGTISSSSTNVISIIGMGATYPQTTTIPNDFNASANFISNSIVTQVRAASNELVTGIVLKHELDASNNNILILHSCNGQFDISSNANSTVGNTSLLDITTYNMILEGTSADLIGDLVLEEDGVSIIALEDSIYRNADLITTASFQYIKSNVIFGISTDFQADFRINDRIKPSSTLQLAEVIEIINSTCLVGNTAISTDISFNFMSESSEFFITENSDKFVLNNIDPTSTKFDNDDILHYNLLESTVRGTTNTNGILSGNTNLEGQNSVFGEDLLVNDIITVSSDELFKAKILSITDQTLTLNRAIGDGTTDQTVTLHTLRNFDLERNEGTISLSNPYDGSNNFMNLSINSSSTGLMLLEDGIGTANAGYSGNTSNEGSFKFEILSTFNNQTSKFIQA